MTLPFPSFPLLTDLLDLLFPPSCHLCGNDSSTSRFREVCDPCLSGLTPLTPPLCRGCALPLDPSSYGEDPADPLCPECLMGDFHFDSVTAPFLYSGTAVGMVRGLKFRSLPGLSRPMAELIAPLVKQSIGEEGGGLLTPVPIHPRTLRRRGFNQAALVARRLGKTLPLPLKPLLKKRGYRTPQEEMGIEERKSNPAGSFTLVERWRGRLKGKRVILIDDVVTTGATISECSRVLKGEGVERVDAVAFARVPRLLH